MTEDFFKIYTKQLAEKGRLKLPKPKDLTIAEFYYLKGYIEKVIKMTLKND